MKGGNILDFLKRGNLRKGGIDLETAGYDPDYQLWSWDKIFFFFLFKKKYLPPKKRDELFYYVKVIVTTPKLLIKVIFFYPLESTVFQSER